eukprot:PLAT5307.2.p1 GENE.PLAT5307.2~~PLAT5307.2.p1  ORF type:complete len:498 (+),score=236.04 PLAT5307.2:3-1496(+)
MFRLAVARTSVAVLSLSAGSALLAYSSEEKEQEVAHSMTVGHAEAVAVLSAVFGERAAVDADSCSEYGSDAWSHHRGPPPSIVVKAHTTEEVSLLLRVCSSAGLPVTPYGSGTSLEGGSTTPRGGVLLDVSEMDAILEVNEADMDVRVQAGVRWEDLNAHLADRGLFFPMDPGPGASIGGMIGTGCSGTNAVRYGTMKAHVLNLTAVLADGRIIKTGRRARKCSAGYDLTSLFVGAEGTLGVVTEATLRLAVRPPCSSVAVVQFESLHDAAATVSAAQRAGIQLGCVELLDSAMMSASNAYAGLTYDAKPTLFFKFAGTRAAVEDSVAQVEALAAEHGGGGFCWAADAAEQKKLWAARKGALWAVQALQPDWALWTTDVCVPLSAFPDVIAQTQEDVKRLGLTAPIVGHAGDGNFHVFILYDRSDDKAVAAAEELNARMITRAIDADGTCTGEHGVGIGKRGYLRRELGERTVDVMREVKAALDPQGLLNPGKVLPE